MLPDYYSILAIRPDASAEEVRAAYRRLAKRHHPDVGGEALAFHAIQEAYGALVDPARRRDYDAQRRQPRLTRSVRVEPVGYPDAAPAESPEPLIPSEPLRPLRSTAPRTAPGFAASLDDLDRLFREFDEFFDNLEAQFLRPSWGRNE